MARCLDAFREEHSAVIRGDGHPGRSLPRYSSRMSEFLIPLAGFVDASRVNGPGLRTALWVQGCSLSPACPGCFNPGLIPEEGEGERVTPEALAARILRVATRRPVDGITFSGGEPTDHGGALARVAQIVRSSGLSIMAYSGRERAALEASGAPEGWAALLAELDILVDGRFVASRRTGDGRGSSNQQRWGLTDRGRTELRGWRPDVAAEFFIDGHGGVRGTGFPLGGASGGLFGGGGQGEVGQPTDAGPARPVVKGGRSE